MAVDVTATLESLILTQYPAIIGDFAILPSEVIEEPPNYHNIITQTESMKKEYINLAATPVRKYRLKFNARTTAIKDAILAHYDTQKGGYVAFRWAAAAVPAHVNSGAAMTGRWIDGSLQFTGVGYKLWNISIGFEKSI